MYSLWPSPALRCNAGIYKVAAKMLHQPQPACHVIVAHLQLEGDEQLLAALHQVSAKQFQVRSQG